MRLRVGITGQAGFVGTHLFNHLGLRPDEFERIPFEDCWFEDMSRLRKFVGECDVIVHLAAMNRCESDEVLYDTNIRLCRSLVEAMEAEHAAPHVMFSSSTQEERDNAYGRSKREGREMLERWAEKNGAVFTGLVVPNVYGEFARPGYNTFIATFAHRLIAGQEPVVMVDSEVKLIYVASLCRFILSQFGERGVRRVEVPWDMERKVSDILEIFRSFKHLYYEQGIIPELKGGDEVNLFNTFRSYITPRSIESVQHVDARGVFVETVKTAIGGQISFSTTVPGITRGNHYHTRKIERFTVIKGRALIQLRKIGSDEVFEFEIDGSRPAAVDMPVWYTHNIKNIGNDELCTQFWINEWYDPADSDTYFEEIER